MCHGLIYTASLQSISSLRDAGSNSSMGKKASEPGLIHSLRSIPSWLQPHPNPQACPRPKLTQRWVSVLSFSLCLERFKCCSEAQQALEQFHKRHKETGCMFCCRQHCCNGTAVTSTKKVGSSQCIKLHSGIPYEKGCVGKHF